MAQQLLRIRGVVHDTYSPKTKRREIINYVIRDIFQFGIPNVSGVFAGRIASFPLPPRSVSKSASTTIRAPHGINRLEAQINPAPPDALRRAPPSALALTVTGFSSILQPLGSRRRPQKNPRRVGICSWAIYRRVCCGSSSRDDQSASLFCFTILAILDR